MNSYRPYLIRALHDWICDNGLTPHLLVDADMQGVSVPPSAVQDGRVVLNIAPRAVMGLNIDQDYVSFSARFSGVSHEIWVPINAVLAIYARENGQGMVIPDDPRLPGDDDITGDDPEIAAADVEQAIELAKAESRPRAPLAAVPTAAVVEDNNGDNGDDDSDPEPPKPPKAPFLRVVK